MIDVGIEETKAALRRAARERRAAISADERSQAGKAAAGHLIREFQFEPGSIVAGYWPIRDELDSRPAMIRLIDGGQPLCLPVVVGEDAPLQLRLWNAGAPLYPSGFGTLAPEESAPLVEPDVVLVPLLGFDRTGTRLGYGGGYYDRTLALLPRRPRLIGLAFDCQELDMVPRGEHDVPLDAVVTETGYRTFGNAA